MRELINILIAVDQLFNTLLFFLPGGAFPDETFSARCWRNRERRPYKTLQPVIDGLFFWQTDHCRKSHESELARRHSPR